MTIIMITMTMIRMMLMMSVRLPVFLMGVSAGLLTLREVEDPHHQHSLLHEILPWIPGGQSTSSTYSSSSQQETERSWARRTDRNSLLLLCLVLYSITRNLLLPSLPNINTITLQVSPHLQLCIILGLTRDGGTSWLARLCRSELVCLLSKNFIKQNIF